MQKTIGIISAHYLPHLGGVERYVFNMATELSHRGFRVIIITSQLSGTKSYELINGIEIYRLPCYGLMENRLPLIKQNSAFRKLVQRINTIKFDNVLINTRFYVLSAWGVRWCQKNKISPILIEHGTAHIQFQNKVISLLGRWYEHILTWYIKRKCQTYVGVSQGCIQWLQHFKIHTDKLLYNAINEQDYKNIHLSFRKDLGISEDAFVITFVGRLIPEKGILKLIRACQELIDENRYLYLLIAGDGNLMGQVKKMCGEHVILLGQLSHNEVISLLLDTNIYCLPTDYPEGFPTSVLEAAMCGCCIMATEAGGTKELVINDSMGYILHDNDVTEIKVALRTLMDDPERIKRMGNNVRQRVMNNYTWKTTVDTLIKIMEDI